MQHSFSTLWNGYATAEEAKAARDKLAREFKAKGCKTKRWVLRNQIKPYESFGVPDGRSCDVYMLDVQDDLVRTPRGWDVAETSTEDGPASDTIAQGEKASAPGYDPSCVFCQSGEEPGHEH